MVKKIFIVFIVLAVVLAVAVNIFSRKAPDLLRQAIEKALNKKVSIASIEYHFPGTFELQGFQVEETREPFVGENLFSVNRLTLVTSPWGLSKKELVINKLEVGQAEIAVRQRHGKIRHVLSEAVQENQTQAGSAETTPSASGTGLPLVIHQIDLIDSRFKFMDYDVAEGGFVSTLEKINAEIKNIALPMMSEPTQYWVKAALDQGRGQRPATIEISGWTVFNTLDTDASLQVTELHLPYFRPYYAQVTGANIQDGYLGSKISLKISQKYLTVNAGLELAGLYFGDYELGNQLFGLKAEEILNFLQDSSGKLRFQIAAQWNIADRSVKAKDVIRRSIEESLKRTVLGNVGNVLENTLQKINEQGFEKTKEDLEGTIDKIKDIFKFG